MKHSKIPLSQTIVHLCKAKDIEHIVISPGSRNAPLTIGFSNNEYFKCYSIVDERCAAFFALGIAQKTQKAVALVCTSGSALLNYYPAISEAFYSDIPLVVLSADRPKYMIGIGDGQTIDQKNVFENHILYSANLKQDITEVYNSNSELHELPIFKNLENNVEKFLGLQQSVQKQNEIEINSALNTALTQRGPVHINIPFAEPLYETTDKNEIVPEIVEADFTQNSLQDLTDFIDIWNKSKRKMILVGVNPPNSIDQKHLNFLAADESVLVFTETTSNLHHDSFLPGIDKVIAPLNDEEFKKLQPDILLTFGGMIVSKKIKAFLREYKPNHHWHVDVKKANDTFFCLDKHFESNIDTFFEAFLNKVEPMHSDYRDYWKDIMSKRRKKHNEYINQIPFSDFVVFDEILKSIPDGINLQVGNSSAIRYLQLFDINNTIKVNCNRGTSGIDGCTSTALGSAVVSKEQTVLISGDLSFFYDSNALWNNYIPINFRIIVVNNGGGGIFRILPGHKNTDNFETYFETKHDLTAEQLCKMYEFEYFAASDLDQLNDSLSSFYTNSDKPKLLEVFTPRLTNDELLLDYFNFIK